MRRRAAAASSAGGHSSGARYGSTAEEETPAAGNQRSSRCRHWLGALLAVVLAACLWLEFLSGYGSAASFALHPLHLAAFFAKEGLLQLMLDAWWIPCGYAGTNGHGMTALHAAALGNSDWALRILLEAGATEMVSARDSRNQTALMLARAAYDAERVRSGPRRLAAFLINAGACKHERCEPADVDAMREWEILAVKDGDRAPGEGLPGENSALSLEYRAALYEGWWAEAHTAAVQQQQQQLSCRHCSQIADLMHATELRLAGPAADVDSFRVQQIAQRERHLDAAKEWHQRSVQYRRSPSPDLPPSSSIPS